MTIFLPALNKKELTSVISQGVVIKKEIYRHRLNNEQKEEVYDDVINKMLVADLLLQQNCDAEKVLLSLKEVKLGIWKGLI